MGLIFSFPIEILIRSIQAFWFSWGCSSANAITIFRAFSWRSGKEMGLIFQERLSMCIESVNKICSFSSRPLISNFQFTIFSHLLLIETVQVSPYIYWGRVTLREKNISFFLSHSPPLPLVLREDIFKGIFLSIISVLSMENLIIFPIFVQSPRYDLA